MKHSKAKIALIIFLVLFINSCDSTKGVKDNRMLLSENKIMVNTTINSETDIENIPVQKPNTTLLGWRFRLAIYNLAKKNADSTYNVWLNRKPNRKKFLESVLSKKQTQRLGKSFIVAGWSSFVRELGEPPQFIDPSKVVISNKRLKSYFSRNGYFNAVSSSVITPAKNGKTAVVEYTVKSGSQYKIDSIAANIETSSLKPLYEANLSYSKIKKDEPYKTLNIEAERERITRDFRNNGVYHFQTNNITYVIDTLNTNHKANISLAIKDRFITAGDTSKSVPFKIYTINRINIFTEDPLSEPSTTVIDSASYKDIRFYSYGKLRYRPKAIADAIFMNNNSLYSDENRTLTTRSLSNLKVFMYPNIQFIENKDSLSPSLTANIYLKPKDKWSFATSFNVIHSNIQDFGITYNASVGIRNVFRGAEILELAGRGNIGSSRNLANADNVFFNVSEYGADLKLSVPRFLSPIGTRKWIPKRMLPGTLFSLGFSKQQNIGLDKQNLIGLVSYNWNPNPGILAKLDLLNIQYIRNVNNSNYFNVYRSSYNRLNEIASLYADTKGNKDADGNLSIESGTNGFISDVLNKEVPLLTDNDFTEVSRIEERKKRLTENNLISASNIQLTVNTKQDELDTQFFVFKTKIESAGAVLSLLSRLDDKNNGITTGKTLYDVAYSQYGKIEAEYIKHWDLSRKRIFAFRGFSGIAVPYGNSNSIPFSRSYFGGGSNDNRAWQPYRLGPGRSKSLNDFNEANFKLAFNLEYRFNIYAKFNGALFIDAGNVWNVFDNIKDTDYTFNGLNSLKDIAIGSGLGLRYDLSFFIIRVDLGFKNYNPANEIGDRWKNKYSFDSSVINIGINYPF